jgi:hypothetical protein
MATTTATMAAAVIGDDAISASADPTARPDLDECCNAQWWQPQLTPHPPPDPATDGVGRADSADAAPPPTDANTDNRRTASGCPEGQEADADASLIGRRTSNVSSQVRQRYS